MISTDNPHSWAKDAKRLPKECQRTTRISNFWQCKIDHCRQIHCCFGRWRRCIFSSTTVSNKARTGPNVLLIALKVGSHRPSWMASGHRKVTNVTKWKSLLLEPCPQLPSKSIVLKKHFATWLRSEHVQQKHISRNSINFFVSLSDWFYVVPGLMWWNMISYNIWYKNKRREIYVELRV